MEISMKKRIVSTLLAGAVVTALFTGCASGNTTTSASSSPSAAAAEEVTEETTEEAAAEATEETVVEEPVEEGPLRSVLTGEETDEELAAQRPIAVMYPINQQAQPQYGLSNVDIFYEIMEEGNMSRQMGIIQDWQGLDRIGNIRSTRAYFVYEALEWDSILIHYGGPIDYTIDILTRDDVDNINGVGGVLGSDYGCFFRVPAGSTSEHTAYTDSDHVNSAIELAGFEKEHREEYYNDKHFTFAPLGEVNDLSQYDDAVTATEIDMAGSFPVTQSALSYNEEDHKYYKTLYHNAQVDGATGEQLAFTNVLIQRCTSYPRVEGSLYLAFQIEETGKDGFYITDGKMIHVTWNKAGDYDPTVFYDDDGNEITVNTGKTMIFIIRDGQDSFNIDGVTYSPDTYHTISAEEAASTDSTEEAAAEEEITEEEEAEW